MRRTTNRERARLVHMVEQAGATLADALPAVLEVYRKCKERGMTDYAATEMAREVLRRIMGNDD